MTYLIAHWQDIKDFFNSVFFTAIAGSFAGAYAGATIAQKIAERAKARETILSEIRNTNAASMMAFSISVHWYRFGASMLKDYPSTLDAIYSYTRDSIYFVYKLCADLKEHGEEVADVYRKKFNTEPPPVSKADFSLAQKAGHIPDAKDYESWDTMFIKAVPSKKKTFWSRLFPCLTA